jgi:hypothetical protein
MKICKLCHNEKPVSDYYKSGIYFFPECKQCSIKKVRKWQKNNPERTRQLNRENWQRHKLEKLEKGKTNWIKRDFNGLRDKVLLRDNYQCVKCGMTRLKHLEKWGTDINVDHIDRNRKNNIMENLQTLCLHCHGKKDNSAEFLKNTIHYWKIVGF